MALERTKIINILDKIILFSLYIFAFFFPISKALIEIASTLAIICYIAKKIIQREGIAKTPLNLAIVAYLAICFFSIFISSNPKISTRVFFGKVVQDILFFFVLVDMLSSERRLRNFLYILFLSSMLLGVDGIYQHFTHKDFIRHRPIITKSRIYATFPTANDFGCYLIAVIPFLVTIFFTKFRLKAVKFILIGLFTLLFTCLIMTVSRGAWFGFMASALFIGVWIYPVGIFLLLLGLFITVTQPFYPTLIKERLNNLFLVFNTTLSSNVGSIERQIFWQAGWKMFMSRPWIGLGLGTFMFNFKRFVVENYQRGPAYAHNCYLQMLSELGIIGLVLFLSILILFFYDGIKIMLNRKKTFSWHILLASLAAVLGYSVQMAVDTIFYNLDLGLLFWLLLGLGTAAMNNIKLETVTPK
ncbi:MAG: O-antigen ligase family protein [Candidatus Omnitrophota bacterium]